MSDLGRPIVAVALDGAGWHPGAWRWPGSRADELFTAAYWVDHVAAAERGVVDLVTFEDSLGPQSSRLRIPDERVDQVRGRLDSVLLATRVAPTTEHIGLVPTAVTQHTEPFHLAAEIASLDFISGGRAGWRPQLSHRLDEARHFGPLPAEASPEPGSGPPGPAARDRRAARLFDEAADVVEVVRRLWDSWEDGAEIRDVPTGRFIDRDKLHYVDFEGEWFSVKGPSITPRSPQGQPLVVALAHAEVPYRFAAAAADIVLVTPGDDADVERIVAEVRAAERQVARDAPPLRILAEVALVIEDTQDRADARLRTLDGLAGGPWTTDAAVVAGDAGRIADLIERWTWLGIDGVRIRPAVLSLDLEGIVDALMPELRRRGLASDTYGSGSLRHRLGFERPESRYAAGAATDHLVPWPGNAAGAGVR